MQTYYKWKNKKSIIYLTQKKSKLAVANKLTLNKIECAQVN